MMKVAIVSYHFDTDLLYRPYQTYRALKTSKQVGKVTVFSSNFDHIRKSHITQEQEDIVRISVPAYEKNISIQRLLSYRTFSAKIRTSNRLSEFDLVIVAVPDYLSAISIIRNRKANSYKLMIDVVDLWPEALPLPSSINSVIKKATIPVLGKIRKLIFEKADRVLLQSHHFKYLFGLKRGKSFTVPMCGPSEQAEYYNRSRPNISESINLLLLGSINSITDIASLISLLEILSISKKVRLAVIGGGNSLDRLKEGTSKLDIETKFYGITFDNEIKTREMSLAHFGYNGYKETTEVAVTYKSMEYLQQGLPLLNSVNGDTRNILSEHNCGLNFSSKDIPSVVRRMIALDDSEYKTMEEASRTVYNTNFSYKSFKRNIVMHSKQLVDEKLTEIPL